MMPLAEAWVSLRVPLGSYVVGAAQVKPKSIVYGDYGGASGRQEWFPLKDSVKKL